MANELFERATDPRQYDRDDIDWSGQVADSPIRQLVFTPFNELRGMWKGKDILEIGCGNGWMTNLVKEGGARYVEGFDPSSKNIYLAKKTFPNINFMHCDLNGYIIRRPFDIVLSNMVFGHIGDLDKALKKIYRMLRKGGEAHIHVPDYEYMKSPRKPEDEAEIEEVSKEEYVFISTRKGMGRFADVVRKPEVYIEAAKKAGLELIENHGNPFTKEFVEAVPRYGKLEGVIAQQFFRFKKNN